MEKMNDLKALLLHEVQDLMSAEDQIIEAMPAMIEKSQNPSLKKALQDHLAVTQTQRKRLDRVQELLNDGQAKEESDENKGFFSNLLQSLGGGGKCKGMEGIIIEGEKILKADMNEEVKDAAIIASAQKVEHYEICGYGTARAYAEELELNEAARLLQQTLDEEYAADDLLTKLAVGNINEKAERGGKVRNIKKAATGKKSATGGAAKKASASKVAAGKAAGGKVANKKAASAKPAQKKAAKASNSGGKNGSPKASNNGSKNASTKNGGKKVNGKRR